MNVIIHGFALKPGVTVAITTTITEKPTTRLPLSLVFAHADETHHHPTDLSFPADELVQQCAAALIHAMRTRTSPQRSIDAHLNRTVTAALHRERDAITVIARLQDCVARTSLPLALVQPFIQAA